MARRGVKGSLATMSVQGIGGFLAASTPAIGTTAVICCLTPTGVNSLLYLLSASVPFIGRNSFGATGLSQDCSGLQGLCRALSSCPPPYSASPCLGFPCISSEASRKTQERLAQGGDRAPLNPTALVPTVPILAKAYISAVTEKKNDEADTIDAANITDSGTETKATLSRPNRAG